MAARAQFKRSLGHVVRTWHVKSSPVGPRDHPGHSITQRLVAQFDHLCRSNVCGLRRPSLPRNCFASYLPAVIKTRARSFIHQWEEKRGGRARGLS